jgi:replication initiation protein RepC
MQAKCAFCAMVTFVRTILAQGSIKMIAQCQNYGAGYRRYDESAAHAAGFAKSFESLPEGKTHGNALTMLKKAAPYLGISRGMIQVIDTLFAWTKAQDWHDGQIPVVWPSNEKLAQKLSVSVRQVQNLLDAGVRAGLISHHDSANGHRVGKRDISGRIIWAYGIVLSPIGARMSEFEHAAQQGAEKDARLTILRKRLSCAARQIASFAQTITDHALDIKHASDDYELAQTAIRQLRQSRNEELLLGCVEQIETKARELEAKLNSAFVVDSTDNFSSKTSPKNVEKFTPYTTTSEPRTAKAAYSRGYPEKSSGSYAVGCDQPQTAVETDLDEFGIDPTFISNVAPDLCYQLEFGEKRWGDIIVVAERLASQHEIHKHAWHEACRIMGQKGAAASVIATIYKHLNGEVHKPGAYLRGMNERAARGELHLGRTFHGLKDRAKDKGMAQMRESVDVSTFIKRATRSLTSPNRVVFS